MMCFFLFMLGDSEKKMERGVVGLVDVLIFDFEDLVVDVNKW